MSEPRIAPAVLDNLLAAGTRLWNEFQILAGRRHHLFVPCDHRDAYEALLPLCSRTTSFLEFGSAAGVVTIMADLLGMEAYGIEIEPWLVQRSAELATRFHSGATFAEGSFVPPEYQKEIEHLASDRITPTDGAAAFDELGLELTDFDLVFAYPWPGEEEWLFELMRRHARPDAILLTYDAQEGYRSEVVENL
jgi:predicted O-methyltransferase YrrM